MIDNIVICGSARYIPEVHGLKVKLLKSGHKKITEIQDVPYPSTYDPLEKLKNKEFYFEKIKEAELVLIYNKAGRIGSATAMEIQFSLDDNRHRPVRFLFKPIEIEFTALCVSSYYVVC